MRYSEPAKLDYNQLKARTIIALDKLGHQKFAAESGGYSLETWVRGVSLLLDEFEEKIGEARLPKEYVEKRRLLTDYFLRPVDTSSIDASISGLGGEEAEVVRKLGDERDRVKARIDGLRKDVAKCTEELEKEQPQAAVQPLPERSGSLLRRLFAGRQASATREETDRRAELEKKLQSLQAEISAQQEVLKSIDQQSPASPIAEDWKALESLQARIRELERERLEKTQLAKEREEFTASIADAISNINVP